MTHKRSILYSGGCQCGGIRYALYAKPFGAHICHCRMCQKAFGNFYAPLIKIAYQDFEWTRGQPSQFKSSLDVDRGFCMDCGTPLTFAHTGTDYINLSIGSFDRPELFKPDIQIGIESRIPWLAELSNLIEESTEAVLSPDRLNRARSLQHPDHDTDARSPGDL